LYFQTDPFDGTNNSIINVYILDLDHHLSLKRQGKFQRKKPT
jgi:hypothetical protein